MDCTSSTSSTWLLVYVAMTAIAVVWSAPASPHYSLTSQTKGNLEHVANVLIRETEKLYSEICKTPNLCGSSVEHILKMDLKLPEIKDIESGCLSTKFNKTKMGPFSIAEWKTYGTGGPHLIDEVLTSRTSTNQLFEKPKQPIKHIAIHIGDGLGIEKCLPKIYNDLLKFQTYLDFLKESMPSHENIIKFIQVKSISLADAIKHLAGIPSKDKEDTTPGITVADLRSDNAWNQNLTSYIILQSFQEYMEKAARAIRNSVKVSN